MLTTASKSIFATACLLASTRAANDVITINIEDRAIRGFLNNPKSGEKVTLRKVERTNTYLEVRPNGRSGRTSLAFDNVDGKMSCQLRFEGKTYVYQAYEPTRDCLKEFPSWKIENVVDPNHPVFEWKSGLEYRSHGMDPDEEEWLVTKMGVSKLFDEESHKTEMEAWKESERTTRPPNTHIERYRDDTRLCYRHDLPQIFQVPNDEQHYRPGNAYYEMYNEPTIENLINLKKNIDDCTEAKDSIRPRDIIDQRTAVCMSKQGHFQLRRKNGKLCQARKIVSFVKPEDLEEPQGDRRVVGRQQTPVEEEEEEKARDLDLIAEYRPFGAAPMAEENSEDTVIIADAVAHPKVVNNHSNAVPLPASGEGGASGPGFPDFVDDETAEILDDKDDAESVIILEEKNAQTVTTLEGKIAKLIKLYPNIEYLAPRTERPSTNDFDDLQAYIWTLEIQLETLENKIIELHPKVTTLEAEIMYLDAKILKLDPKKIVELDPKPERDILNLDAYIQELEAYIRFLKAKITKLDPKITLLEPKAMELDGGHIDVLTFLNEKIERGMPLDEFLAGSEVSKHSTVAQKNAKYVRELGSELHEGHLREDKENFKAKDINLYKATQHHHVPAAGTERRRLSTMARLCKETRMAAKRD